MSGNNAEPKDLITVAEAAKVIKKKPPTVYAQIQKGYVKAHRQGRHIRVSKSQLLAAQEEISKGRPPGSFELDIENRELIEHRDENHHTGLPYSLYKDPSVKPSYWLHCHEHARQYGMETQREAVNWLAKPWLWCPECCELYSEKYGKPCRDE